MKSLVSQSVSRSTVWSSCFEVLVHGGFAFEVGLGVFRSDGAEEEDAQQGLVAADAVGFDVGDPALELGASLLGDRVVLAAAWSLVADLDEAVVGEAVEFAVELALGGRPDERQGAVEGLEEVVTARGSVGEETERCVSKTHDLIISLLTCQN